MKIKIFLYMVLGALWFGVADCAFASQGAPSWRPTYDLVMIWVNFLILAFALYKLLKKPLKGFLESRKQELASGIENVESQKRVVAEEIDAVEQMVKESAARLEKVRERIVSQGESEKERIIAEAREQSRRLMENAQSKVENHFRQARAKIREELLDAAFTKAFERLPQEIGAADQQGFLDRFLTLALSAK